MNDPSKVKTQKAILFKLVDLILILILLAASTYVVYRAYNVSFTHDEGLSYKIISGEAINLKQTANHHILNTKLMKVSSGWFGESELALRLPNVLAFFIYGAFAFLFTKKVKYWWLKIVAIYFLVLNPFLLEYFSLARGYGLSLGFLLPSLYYFQKLLQTKNIPPNKYVLYFFLSLTFSILACWANLMVLIINFAILFLLGASYITEPRRLNNSKLIHFTFLALIVLANLILSYEFIKHLQQLQIDEQLYFGSDQLLDTLKSLGHYYFGEIDPHLQLFHFGVIAFFLSLTYFHGLRSKLSLNNISPFLFLVLLLFFEMSVLNLFFEAKYPLERTTLVLFPLISLVIIFSIQNFQIENRTNSYVKAFTLFLFISTISLSFNRYNLKNTSTWFYDQNNKVFLDKVNQISKSRNKIASISNHWFFEPGLNYYIKTMNYNIDYTSRNEINVNSDFIVKFKDNNIMENFDQIAFDEESNTILLQNKSF